MFFWDLIRRLPSENNTPDLDALVLAVRHDVLRTSVGAVTVAEKIMPARCFFILIKSESGRLQLHSHSATQGFDHLMRSIITHVVDMAVDVIVPGTWLCTLCASLFVNCLIVC